jgi:uncharacterized protein YecE (DUF72 family)
MRMLAGTSGWSFKEWKGSFYPKGLAQDEELGYYAGKFSTVEINNTFYRMPKESVLMDWAAKVPPTFRFAIKASQRITHHGRLKDVADSVEYLTRMMSVLEERRGPTLFQLPPNLKKDVPRLRDFLEVLPRRWKSAFEFRHESWFDEDVFGCLRAHSSALCFADAEDGPGAELVKTADWGYVRLRREEYSDDDLRAWIDRLRSQGWDEACVFFKHEDAGTGPRLASRFLELAGP